MTIARRADFDEAIEIVSKQAARFGTIEIGLAEGCELTHDSPTIKRK
jgi:hypothetical protein